MRRSFSARFISLATITEPAAVLFSALHTPIVWPHGVVYYLIETATHRVGSAKQPLLRDAAGQPVVLTEELAVGSVVQIAIADDGMMRAVKILERAWADPFAPAA
jgi:hypothetical protein